MLLQVACAGPLTTASTSSSEADPGLSPRGLPPDLNELSQRTGSTDF